MWAVHPMFQLTYTLIEHSLLFNAVLFICTGVVQKVGIVQEVERGIHHEGDPVADPDLVTGGCGIFAYTLLHSNYLYYLGHHIIVVMETPTDHDVKRSHLNH